MTSAIVAMGIAMCGLVRGTTADTFVVPDQFETIQMAIDAAADGDEIVVQPGVYAETIDYLGKEISITSTQGAEATTIDGTDLGTSVVSFRSLETESSVLEGFTITGGSGTMSLGMRRGGGLYAIFASPTIRECVFKANQTEAGGGMALYGSNAVVQDCVFAENVVTGSGSGGGGGVHIEASYPTFSGCHVTHNEAQFFSPGGAVGVFNFSNAAFINCVFDGNTGRHTGGINNSQSVVRILNCTLSDNVATNRTSGHALRSSGSNAIASVINSIIWGNGEPDEADGVTASSNGQVNISYSNVEGGWEGEGNLNTNPIFVASEHGDYHLLHQSPLVNAGNSDALPKSVETDCQGLPRYVDPLDPTHDDPPIDMGAFETQWPQEEGACCYTQTGQGEGQECESLTILECADLDGQFLGFGIDCEQALCEPICAGDANEDGLVDVTDLLMVVNGWGDCLDGCEDSDCAGDLNEDCSVNVNDLLLVIQFWGGCGDDTGLRSSRQR